MTLDLTRRLVKGTPLTAEDHDDNIDKLEAAVELRALSSDARLTDSREWTAATVDQAEAEAGTATTRRAWTALRVFQSVAAWWAASAAKTKLDGIASGATANSSDATLLNRANHTGTQAVGTITGLATVATSGAYNDLSGRPTLGTAAAAATTDFAPASQGVTNGNSHDHNGGDGGQVAYSSLSGTPSLGGAAALNVGTTAGTVAAGDDARLSDARTPTAHNQAWSTITSTPTTLAGYGITDAASDGDITLSGLTQATARLIGRTTASTGAPEEISVSADLSLSGGVLGVGSSVATLTGTQTLSNKVLQEVKETVYTIVDGAAFEIDPANGPIQTVTLGANRTPAATNFESGQSVKLKIDDGTAYAITWSTVGVVWIGQTAGSSGTAPTLGTTGFTHVELWKEGATVYGSLIGYTAT